MNCYSRKKGFQSIVKLVTSLLIFTIIFSLFSSVLAASGDLDTTFGMSSSGLRTTDINAGSLDTAYGLALQTDGKIVLAGVSDTDIALARYTSSGVPDTTFDTDGIVTTSVGGVADVANDVALQTDGKIVVAGSSSIGATDHFLVARYNTNGSLDTSFGAGGPISGVVTTTIGVSGANANTLAIQPDGKIVAVGSANGKFAVARYTTSGVLDPTFGSGGVVITTVGAFDQAYGVVIDPDGKIIVVGASDQGSSDDFAIVRYTSTGSLDFSFDGTGKVVLDFGPGNNDFAHAVALTESGQIIVAGYTATAGNGNDFALARLNSNGGLDTSFGTNGKTTHDFAGGDDDVEMMVIQPTGRIVLGGFAIVGGSFDFALARFTVSGILDTSFGTGGSVTTDVGTVFGNPGTEDYAYGFAIQPDNKIVVGGTSDYPASIGDFNFVVARYTSPNNAPTVSNVTKNGTEDNDVTFASTDFTSHFSDADGDALAKIKVTTLPANGTLSLNAVPVTVNQEILTSQLGNLVFTPTTDWNGATSFGWNGSDGLVYATTGALVNINITAVNDAPINTVPAAFAVDEDTPQTGLAFSIADVDAGSATNFQFTLSATNGTLTLTPTDLTLITGNSGTSSMTYEGTLAAINTALSDATYQGNSNFAGEDTITLASNDNGNTGSGGSQTDSDPVSVTVNQVNDAPVLDPIGNQTTDELTPLSFTAHATDIENNTLTYALDAGAPTGADINPSTGVFTWTPTEIQGPGVYTVTVRVTDNGTPALDAFETLQVTVNDVNQAPVLDSIGNLTAYEDTLLTFTAIAADSDVPTNTLTYALDAGTPTGASIDPSTGVFTWTPTEAQAANTYTVTVRVTDDGVPPLDDFETFQITVTPVNDAPTFTASSPVTVDEDAGPQTVSGWATNLSPGSPFETNQTLTFIATPSDPNAFAIPPAVDSTSGDLTFTTAENFFGSVLITVTLMDDGGILNGGQDTSTPYLLTLNVNAINDAPTVTDFVKIGATNEVISFTLQDFTQHYADVDGDAMATIRITSLPTRGTLMLGSQAVTLGQVIPAEEAILAQLVFTPETSWTGITTFTWTGNDGTIDAVMEATVTLKIGGNYWLYLPLIIR